MSGGASATARPGGVRIARLNVGPAALGQPSCLHWLDIHLDRPQTRIWGTEHGWVLRGGNPDTAGDHIFTYRHEGNHGLIRAALNGGPLGPPLVPS